MDRVSGWYKRRDAVDASSASGSCVAVGLNINTLAIADYLYRNDAARAALVARAEVGGARTPRTCEKATKRRRSELDRCICPIGWAKALEARNR